MGSSTLEITGVDELHPTAHVAVADRIVAGTWAFAAAATLGDVTVRNAHPEHLELALDKLVRSGADVELLADGFRLQMHNSAAQLRRRDPALSRPGDRSATAGDRAAVRSPTGQQ